MRAWRRTDAVLGTLRRDRSHDRNAVGRLVRVRVRVKARARARVRVRVRV